jgi:hypothetical protein
MTHRERLLGLALGYTLYYGVAWPLIWTLCGWAWRPER